MSYELMKYHILTIWYVNVHQKIQSTFHKKFTSLISIYAIYTLDIK